MMCFRVFASTLVTVALATVFCQADELPVLSKSAEPFSFAVLGDTHYTAPEFKVRPLIHRLGEEIRTKHPEVAFVCQTGDVVEGGTYATTPEGKRKFVLAGYEGMKQEWTFAMGDLGKALGRPLFISVGNHDKHDPGHKAFREIVLPQIGKQLGRPLEQTWFAFRYGNACFVFLDFAPADMKAQATFVDETLAAAKAAGAKHLFLFAHYPLWTVARSGFSSPALTESLLPLVKKYRVDAYFCGHTHNTIACVREFDGQPVTQIQGVTTVARDQLIPIEERRALLFPAAETPYCWGYLEGSPAGYYLVRVDGPKVEVAWCVPGRGAVRKFAWQEPGRVSDVEQPAPVRRPAVSQAQLETAKEAAVVFCPWAEGRTPINVTVNGQPVAEAQIGPSYNVFWEEKRIAIPRDKLSSLRVANRVEIGNPERAVFGVAHLRLEVTLADGTQVATPVCGDFAFSCSKSEAGKRTRAWETAPHDRIREAALGQAVGPMEVRFGP
jgi:3',5'-cyclic AMP phosphodiesterase CpdA